MKKRRRKVEAIRRLDKNLSGAVLNYAAELVQAVAKKRCPKYSTILSESIVVIPVRGMLIIKAKAMNDSVNVEKENYAQFVDWNPGDVRTQIRQAIRAFAKGRGDK